MLHFEYHILRWKEVTSKFYLWVPPKLFLKILAVSENIPVTWKRIRIILLLQLIKMFLFPANDTPYERVLRIAEKEMLVFKYMAKAQVLNIPCPRSPWLALPGHCLIF